VNAQKQGFSLVPDNNPLSLFSLLNPNFPLEFGVGAFVKTGVFKGVKSIPWVNPATVDSASGVIAAFAIPLYIIGTATDATNLFVQEATATLPVNPQGEPQGVSLGGGVYWDEEYTP
jgi:hypothetical protein